MKTPNPGIYDVSLEEYLEWEALSSSMLRKLLTSPAHMKQELEEPTEPTKSQRQGSVVHKAVLEPDTYEHEYTALGNCEDTYNDGRDCTASAKYIVGGMAVCGRHGSEEDHDDSVNIVKRETADMAEGIRKGIERTQKARLALSGDRREVSIVWNEGITEGEEVLCKARIDSYRPGQNMIADLKTTRKSASPGEFGRAIWNYRYDLQACWYQMGANEVFEHAVDHFVFVPVEKKPPYAVGPPQRLREYQLEMARDEIRGLLGVYAECKRLNHWPAYADEVRDVETPPWAEKEREKNIDRIDDMFQNLIHNE